MQKPVQSTESGQWSGEQGFGPQEIGLSSLDKKKSSESDLQEGSRAKTALKILHIE